MATVDMVTVREATFSDYAGVMEISEDIYGGGDYLHCMYHILLQDKNSNCFVITINGKIAGYMNCHIMDEGRTCVKIALRIGKDYRGKGLSKILETEALKKTLAKHPNIKTLSKTAQNQPAIQKTLKENPDKVLHLTLKRFEFPINLEEIPLVAMATKKFSSQMQNIRRLSLFESYKILSDADVRKRLFPGKYFVAGYGAWLPFVVNDANLRLVAMQSDISASFSPDGTCETLCIRTVYPLVTSGVFVDLWCYGNAVTPEMVMAYMSFWLNTMTSFPDNRIHLGLEFPDHVDKQQVHGYLHGDTWLPVAKDSPQYCEIVLIDQPMRTGS